MNPSGTIFEVKRKIGTDYKYQIHGNEYSTKTISYYIFSHLKKEAEEYFGDEIKQAVITVPAHFSQKKREEITSSAEQANLEVLRIINEPTAAALAYAYLLKNEGFLLVYDLGGGTFDVTILHKTLTGFNVKASLGDSDIGGRDFDQIIFDKVLKHFEDKFKIEIKDLSIQKQLLDSVELAKKELSDSKTSVISLPFVNKKGKPIHLNYELTREEFQDLIKDKIEKTFSITDKAIQDARILPANISGVIFSGGSSRIPIIQEIMESKYQFQKIYKINPDEIVSLGAAVMTTMLEKKEGALTLKDVSYFTLGLESENNVFIPLIKRNTLLPAKKKKYFTTVVEEQDNVEIHILQGEDKNVENNISLGKFLLSGIKNTKLAKPKIEVIFEMDENSITKVYAKDLGSGNKNEINIVPISNYDKDEVSTIALKIETLLKQIEYIKSQFGFNSQFEKEYDELCEFYLEIKERKGEEELKDVLEALETFYKEIKEVIFDN